MRRKFFTTSKLPLKDPPAPVLVNFTLVLGFQSLKLRSIPAISKCTCELGSNATFAMKSGVRLGVLKGLGEVLSSCVPGSVDKALGATIDEPPEEPPVYWLGFSAEKPMVTVSVG